MISGYLEKLGPPEFRRKLADLAVVLIPDKNLGRVRDISQTLYKTSSEILKKKREDFEKGSEGDNMISAIRMVDILPIQVAIDHKFADS